MRSLIFFSGVISRFVQRCALKFYRYPIWTWPENTVLKWP